MASPIKFGTDGWRGIIADDFTFANVARCSQGLADYIRIEGSASRGLVVGYDTRFASREFAETVASVISGNGIGVYLCREPAPTPVVSHQVVQQGAAGGVVITSSHNPAAWSGFKFKSSQGGSASQAVTDTLELCIESAGAPKNLPLDDGRAAGLVQDVDPAPAYGKAVAGLVNLEAIRNAGLSVLVDAMHGAGAGYVSSFLDGGATSVKELRAEPNPAFPGMAQPEPIAHNLTELCRRVPADGASAGLALDGDADRIGLVDETGRFVSTLEVFSLLTLYLLERGDRGALVKGVTASVMLNKLAEQYGVPLAEMPVGFKNIGPRFVSDDAILGGEESGGYAFRGHIPERDGILSGLYLLEYMAVRGFTASGMVRHLFDTVGEHHYQRRDVSFDPSARDAIMARLTDSPLTELAGMTVSSVDQIDGRRWMFDAGWVAARFSGTEPLLRIYCEADSTDNVSRLLDAMQAHLGV
ncbi:MAG: phosphoglucomutase/phosphomannomutase family protein [Chloroflexi bacterium]|nr:phosphoglucomutase/phosphomannomutase family protein [Chloroflexota bacterium]MYD47438.1 phosphoglucomutase/phosphomannomutase family protein [Chloroflexota bacterium]